MLFDSFLSGTQRSKLAVAFTGSDKQAARDLTVLLAAWHDIGKAAPAFQVKDGGLPAGHGDYDPTGPDPEGMNRHDRAGFSHTRDWLIGHGVAPRAAYWLSAVVGGHHGRFPDKAREEFGHLSPHLHGRRETRGAWSAARSGLMADVADALVPERWADVITNAAQAAVGRDVVVASTILSGIVIVADWLVSDTTTFIDSSPRLARTSAVAWLNRQRPRVLAAIQRAGLEAAPVVHAPFVNQFPDLSSFEPRGVQRFVIEDLEQLGPGLTLLCDQTGGGKTAAFLHAASILNAQSGDAGFLVALPTTATTDAMFDAVATYLDRNASASASLTLMHSLAFIRESYLGRRAPRDPTDGIAPLIVPETPDVAVGGDAEHHSTAAGLAEVTDWLLGRRRGLLAPYTVCTIDQVLAVAIARKWASLPFVGLTRRVIVIDEVHAQDPHMQELFLRLIEWLAACGVSVVAASASLPTRTANAAIDHYRAGLACFGSERPRPIDLDQLHFPGWSHTSSRDGTVAHGPVSSPRRRATHVNLVGYAAEADSDDPYQAFREATLTELARVLSGAEGNVLVVCNTVAAAVSLRDALAATQPDLPVELMHSRFPQAIRAAQASRLRRLYGPASTARPRRSVVIATQVAEQSLDIDLDLVITQLAPMAALIQREGRLHRHQRRRPPHFATPTMVLLVEWGEDGLATPDERPYDRADLNGALESLLSTTSGVRPKPGTPIALEISVPDDVQRLVDDAYSGDRWNFDAMAAEARTQVMKATARAKAIPPVRSVKDLSSLTERGPDSWLDDADNSARFGLNSVSLLLLEAREDVLGFFVGGEPDAWRPLPLHHPSVSEQRDLAEASIPVSPHAGWKAALDTTTDTIRPADWLPNLRHRLLVVDRAEDGTLRASVGSARIRFSTQNGLEAAAEKAAP